MFIYLLFFSVLLRYTFTCWLLVPAQQAKLVSQNAIQMLEVVWILAQLMTSFFVVFFSQGELDESQIFQQLKFRAEVVVHPRELCIID